MTERSSGGKGLIAQDCSDFFPMNQGTILKYVNYDTKDRVTGGNEISFSEPLSSFQFWSQVTSPYRFFSARPLQDCKQNRET